MKHLLAIAARLFAGERRAFLRGFALTVTVLAMGAALLGLSGWFITAAAAAGLAGTGVLFNVFAPSAAVRFLALGRSAARYGERLATHDATLRGLSRLRVDLLTGLLNSPQRALERLRANAFLNRVTADVDALDGIGLRLLLPGLAGGAVILATAVALWVLVHPAVALVVAGGLLILPTLVFWIGQRRARRPARQAEAALQAGRSRLIDLIAAREDLAVYRQLETVAATVRTAFDRQGAARAALERVERRTGFGLDIATAGVTAAALGIGAQLAAADVITPAQAALGVLAALALGETVAPVRRALSEMGRMSQAARRVLPSLDIPAPAPLSGPHPEPVPLQFEGVTYHQGGERAIFAPVTLSVAPGETVALTGPSGSGKSTLLLMAAGALDPTDGSVTLGGRAISGWDAEALRKTTTLVPQRHALIAGTVADNLRLAAPQADDTALWGALEAVCLAATIRDRGGLGSELGFRGAGLSGGEARRLVLARALLCRPRLLLLDEPTEGLDPPTAAAVMSGLRAALPDTAILMAAHRRQEISAATRVHQVEPART